jgi:hypothetical protein
MVFAVLIHLLFFLLAHRPTQHVGATERVATDDLRNLHHLLLIDDDAVGRLQTGFQIVVEIIDLLLALLAQDEVIHHPRAKRAWAVERKHGDDVFEAIRCQFLQELLHALRFNLEDGRGVGVLQDLVGRRVVETEQIQVVPDAGELFDVTYRQIDNRQVAQTEEVELHQADFFDIVLVVLRNHRSATVGRIERAEVGQLARRDEHAAGVHANVAGQIFELAGQLEELADFLFGLHFFAQLRLGFERFFQRQRLVLLDRDQLRQRIAEEIGHVEHTPDVADDCLRRHGAECGDLRHRLLAIGFTHILDHPPAIVLAEVDVEVGHRYPLRVEEALEEQCVGQRIEVGDAQRIGNQRTGTGTPAGADRNPVFLAPIDEVGHDQEVAGETHLHDGIRLDLEPGFVGGALALAYLRIRVKQRQTNLQPPRRLMAEMVVKRHALWRRELRQIVLAERDLDIAAAGNLDRVFHRLRQIGKQRHHVSRGFEILFLGEGFWSARIAEHITLGNAHTRFVRLEVIAIEELDRVRRNQWQPELRSQLGRRRHQHVLPGMAGTLHFQIVGTGKQRRPGLGPAFSKQPVAREQGFADIAQRRTGKGDQPVDADILQHPARDLGTAARSRCQLGTGKDLAQLQITLMISAQ